LTSIDKVKEMKTTKKDWEKKNKKKRRKDEEQEKLLSIEDRGQNVSVTNLR